MELDEIGLCPSQTSRRSIFQSPVNRKEALRSVVTKIQNLNEHANLDVLQTLEGIFKEADDIYSDVPINEKIINQDEVVLDSEVMSVSSKIIKTCTHTLTKECSDFDPHDFADKLLRFVNHLPDTTVADTNWSLLESDIPSFQTTSKFTCLLDSLNLTKKKTKKQLKMEKMQEKCLSGTQRTRLNHNIARKKPEKVVQLDKEEKGIEQTIHHIKKLIKHTYKAEKKPINYFRLALDPGDFGKTIENMLHLSFLCKDGHVQMTTDDDLNLVVVPSSKEAQTKATGDNGMLRFQNIVNLEMDTWNGLKDIFRMTEPMINF